MAVSFGGRTDAAVCPFARHEPLWRSRTLDFAEGCVVHVFLISELPQISALAFVSADDAGAGVNGAGAAGPGNAARAATDSGLWPRALVLLCPAPSLDPCVIRDGCVFPSWPRRLAFRQLRRFGGRAVRLRIWAPDGLSGLGRCRVIALSCVPLVRRC